MPNTNELKLEGLKLKMLLVGPSGVGKTHLAGTFPKPYLFNFDVRGVLTLRGKDIDYDTFTDYKDIEPKLNEVEEGDKYDTLVFDPITRLADLMMDEIQRLNLSESKKARTSTRMFGFTPPPTTPEYGIFLGNMSNVLDQVLKIDKNIVFVAHEEMMKDDLTGSIERMPMIVTKMRFRLSTYFDEVYRLECDKGVYKAITRWSRKFPYVRSSFSGVLPDVIEDTSYDKIIKLIKEEGGEDERGYDKRK